MDLTTRYLGLTLPHPLILGASPLVDDMESVRRAEDAGAAAIVMHSLFEEQVLREGLARRSSANREDSFAEALYLNQSRSEFKLGAESYLEQIRRIKDAVKIPVIASLNGISSGGWLEFARLIDQAGADALELNVYRVAADPGESAETIEEATIEMVGQVKAHTSIPIAVKLSPFYTSLAHFVQRLTNARVDGLVLFNRFYQPDIDLEHRDVAHKLELSSSSELLLRLRWLAILSAQVDDVSLGVTGGVHSTTDAVKAVMAGADAVQIVSDVLKRGLFRFAELKTELAQWLETNGYASLARIRGTMNLKHCPDPSVYERANYMRMLNSWRPPSRPL